MRGDTTAAMMQLPSDYSGYSDSGTTAAMTTDGTSNIEQSTNFVAKMGSIYVLMMLTVLYIIWGYWENKSLGESFKIGDLKINLSNFCKVTIAVIIGVNLINVFLTKLAAMRIPVLSSFAGSLLPFFSL